MEAATKERLQRGLVSFLTVAVVAGLLFAVRCSTAVPSAPAPITMADSTVTDTIAAIEKISVPDRQKEHKKTTAPPRYSPLDNKIKRIPSEQ